MADFKEKGYGNTASCPKVSAERFGELVSLYLDKESSDAELELLSLVIVSDENAKRVFKESCRIHLATCRMFGKTCVLTQLPGFRMPRRKRISRKRAALEWTAVAALMFLSFVLFLETKTLPADDSSFYASNDMSMISDAGEAYDISVSDTYMSNGKSSSIFQIDPKK